ncbi:23 kDa integral membrane protein-like [Panonychus citri]|uniref:23 kDa integral membrane protein-like n=1 Tax=Panonychus citri TaxID=50023 RepID=UPI0023074442|nr:23 kDa integral membrane protein-like [Panonychus citri]XP_053210470.1 23 kDa integral membrane protein-like [Panonychus citri]
MVKGCSNSCIQVVLFTFNFIFVCLGAAISGLGVYFLVKSMDFKQIIDTPDSGAIIVILTGVAVFVISFFGCFGAIKESSCMLRMYCFTVGILAILLIIPVIIFIIYNVKIDDVLEKQLKTAFNEYRINSPQKNSVSAAIDSLQWSFKCCGYNGPTWWAANLPEFSDQTVPASCCVEPTASSFQAKCRLDQVQNTQGCDTELRKMLKLFLNVMIAVLLIIGLTLLVAACFACVLANAV